MSGTLLDLVGIRWRSRSLQSLMLEDDRHVLLDSPIVEAFETMIVDYNGIAVTVLAGAGKTAETAVRLFGVERVLVPTLPNVRVESAETNQ